MQILSTNSLFVGKVAIYLEQTDSTNTYAKKLLSKSKPTEGTVIYAGQQVAGRGQIGSKWQSDAHKNILSSVILYPNFLLASQQFALNKVTSLAVIYLLQEYLSEENLYIKWPNDIYINDKKIGGILIENSLKGTYLQNSVIGIGLNINQEKFDSTLPNPTSLLLATAQEQAPTTLLGVLCQKLEQRYLQLRQNSPKIHQDYLRFLFGYNQWRSYLLPQTNTTMQGKITGVSSFGKLQVQTQYHPLEFDLKEIKFLF